MTINNSDGNEDPLGMRRFALTESAYDLVNSLIGIYARACFRDSQNVASPVWKQRLDEIHALKRMTDWADLVAIQHLIDQLSAEYKQAVLIENGQLTYDTTQSGTLHSA